MSTPREAPPEVTSEMVEATVKLLLAGYATKETLQAIADTTQIPFKALATTFGILSRIRRLYRDPAHIQRIFDTKAMTRKPKTAVQVVEKANGMYRVAFLLNSARRIHLGGPEQQNQEQMYWHMHNKATIRRNDMARAVDRMYAVHGVQGMLGWHATMDVRTSAECRAAHGKNFKLLEPPVIGYPGTVHPNCRCTPGLVWPGAKMVNESSAVRNSDSARIFESGTAF
jgi:SPP1 gp7 family putative phage head morphogenesis protein